MGLREALTALRRSWWVPVLTMLLGGAAALGFVLVATPQYTAHMRLFISTTQTNSSTDVYQGSQFSQQRVTSYAQLLTGEELSRRVVDGLGLHVPPSQLQNEIQATVVPNTVLLDVDVTDPSATRARDVADALGVEFSRMVAQLETPPSSTVPPVKVTVVDRPDLPSSPSQPQIVRDIALGLLAGLAIGVGIVVARVRLDRTVHDPEEIAGLVGTPLIGTVLRDDVLAKRHVFERSGSHRATEDYRRLRTNLQFLSIDNPPRVIMVSSAMPSEGKTTLTINLALALAEAGRRVTVVEADLRRPRLTRYLGMVGGVGLTNILAGEAELDEVVQAYQGDSITVLGAGPIPPNPGELLASGHMSALLEKIRSAADYVLIDAPPLLPVADSTGLAVLVDGVLLSVRYGRTTKEQVGEAVATLNRVHATPLGIVLNIVPAKADIADSYGYGSRYEYDSKSGRHRSEPSTPSDEPSIPADGS